MLLSSSSTLSFFKRTLEFSIRSKSVLFRFIWCILYSQGFCSWKSVPPTELSDLNTSGSMKDDAEITCSTCGGKGQVNYHHRHNPLNFHRRRQHRHQIIDLLFWYCCHYHHHCSHIIIIRRCHRHRHQTTRISFPISLTSTHLARPVDLCRTSQMSLHESTSTNESLSVFTEFIGF